MAHDRTYHHARIALGISLIPALFGVCVMAARAQTIAPAVAQL